MPKAQKTTATGKPLIWENVATGIYRYVPTGKYYERIRVGKKPTWKKIEAFSLEDAKKIRAARITRGTLQGEGIAPPEPPEFSTVGEVLDFYLGQGCPDRDRQARDGKALAQDKSRMNILSFFWKRKGVEEIRLALLDEYSDWRKRQTFNGKKTKGRAIDLELNT